MLVTACSGSKSNGPARSIASIAASEISVIEDLDEKLLQIHIYKIIAQNQVFISATEATLADDIKIKPSNLRFQAAEIQAEKVEHQILNDIKFTQNKQTITLRIKQIAEKSLLHDYTLDGLRSKLGLRASRELVQPTKAEIETEIRYLSSSTQYQVFLQNVEHLSFMLETRVIKNNMRFYTSSSKSR
jgi:hypothetical protein